MSHVPKKIIEIIAEQALLDVADVAPQSTLDDLGLDSLGVVETIFGIEEAFDIQVPFNANEPEKSNFDISTVQSIISAVEDLIKEQG